jgi:hypothetical protein
MTRSNQRMLDNERGALWQTEGSGYSVVTEGAVTTPAHTGLSHPAAMRVADELRRGGQVATVVHVVGDQSYEVDRYPVR